MYRRTQIIHQIHAKLRDRLPFAPITPSIAAEVLSEEYPYLDSGVTVHLVGCVEGNGIRLSLVNIMALFRTGYRDQRMFITTTTTTTTTTMNSINNSSNNNILNGEERNIGRSVDHHRTAITQWGPMEETLFTALYINLLRRKQQQQEEKEKEEKEQNLLWKDILERNDSEKKSHKASDEEELFHHLCEKFQLLVDVANFVHYSTLSLKPRRLEILSVVLEPFVQDIVLHWSSHIKERISLESLTLIQHQHKKEEEEQEQYPDHHLFLLQLYKLGSLAGKCLRLYGKCFTAFHNILCEIFFFGVKASHILLQQQPLKQEEEYFRACVVYDIIIETHSLFNSYLSHTVDERQYWCIIPIHQWLQKVVEITEYFSRDVIKTLSLDPNTLNDNKLLYNKKIISDFHKYCVEILHTLAMCLALYQCSYSKRKDSINRSEEDIIILQRGLDTIRCLLQSILLRRNDKSTLNNMSFSLTVKEWCKCCEAAEVLRALSEVLEKNNVKDIDIRFTLLSDALRYFTNSKSNSDSISNNKMHTQILLPLSFYLILVKCMQTWQISLANIDQEQQEKHYYYYSYDSLLHTLWNTTCTSFPSLFDTSHQPTPPAWSLIEFLESLNCTREEKHVSHINNNNNNNSIYEQQCQQLRNICLTHIHHALQLPSTEVDTQLLRLLLHTGSIAKHPPIAQCLYRLLLPLSTSIERLSYSYSDSYSYYSHMDTYTHTLSYSYIINTTSSSFSSLIEERDIKDWSTLTDESCGFLTSPSQRCLMRKCTPANTLTALVELLTPLLIQQEEKEKKENKKKRMLIEYSTQKRPFAVLRWIYALSVSQRSLSRGRELDGSVENIRVMRSSPVCAFFIECYNQLLLLSSLDLLPIHICRILRVLFIYTPHVFVHVPELPRLLLRRLLFLTTTITKTTTTTANDSMNDEKTDINNIMESAESRELWEIFLWTCAVTVSHLGRRSLLDICHRDDDDDDWFSDSTETITDAVHMMDSDDNDDDNAKYIVRILSSMSKDDEISDLFVLVQQQVVQRALKLLS